MTNGEDTACASVGNCRKSNSPHQRAFHEPGLAALNLAPPMSGSTPSSALHVRWGWQYRIYSSTFVKTTVPSTTRNSLDAPMLPLTTPLTRGRSSTPSMKPPVDRPGAIQTAGGDPNYRVRFRPTVAKRGASRTTRVKSRRTLSAPERRLRGGPCRVGSPSRS